MIRLECAVIDIQRHGAQLRTVDESDQLQLRRVFLLQLLQKIALDHSGRDDILQQIDVLSGDVGPVQIIDLHRARDLGIGHLPDHVDISVADVSRHGAHQVREKQRRPLQHAQQKHLGLPRIFADFGAELTDSLGDLFLAERLLDSCPQWQPRTDRRRRP